MGNIVWIGIAVGAIIFVVFCIIGIVVVAKQANSKNNAENSMTDTPENHVTYIMEQITNTQRKALDLQEEARKKYSPISTQSSATCDQLMEICHKQDAMLNDLLSKYGKASNVDADFAELLVIWKRKQNNVNDEFLSALQKCREKNLSETQAYVELQDKRTETNELLTKLHAEIEEWLDAVKPKARTTWNNPECEKYCNKLLELKNKIAELEQDKEYKEYKEKSAQWAEFEKHSVLASSGTTFVNIGRNVSKVAIWDCNTQNGQVISIDDVMYFQIESKTTTNTYTHSAGSSSKLGTAINEAIWGTAAATASAMQKNQQSTTTYSNTQKKAKIYFNFETNIAPLEVSLNSEVDKLIAIMPEKQR